MRHRLHPLLAALALAPLAAAPRAARAQVQASEPAAVSQTVDGTRITIEYSRPRARGRTGLFGSRIRTGEMWTPGANVATTLALSKDAAIEGAAVPKGKYSVWIVTAPAGWEMVLDPDTMRFHTMRPGHREGQIRFPVRRETRPFMEVLTWWFPEVASTGATLAMQWDTVYVPLHVRVQPSFTRTVPADVARRLVGRYRVVNEPMPGTPPDGGMDEDAPTPELTLTVRYEGDELRGVMDPPLFRSERGYTEWILLPRKAGWFTLGRFDGGELVEIVDMASLRFADGDRPSGFELRATDDMLLARGTRLP